MIPPIYQQSLVKDFKDYEFLPINFPTTRTFGIFIEPIGEIKPYLLNSKYDKVDEELDFFVQLLTKNFRDIVNQFNEDYIFAEPQLIFHPKFGHNSARLGLKIMMLEREDYEYRIKK
jgi:hypothetical protein